MNAPESQTIEQVLFDNLGVSAEDAFAMGADVVDEKVAQAAESGIELEPRLSSLADMLLKLTEPKTMGALNTLLERLPQLAELARLADEMPNVIATLGDVFDDFQQRCATEGIDLEKAMTNGLQAALWLGSHIDNDHLRRIGDLLDSDILNPHAVSVVNNAAQSLTNAQQQVCEAPARNRVGMIGLLGALRNPEIQRSLAFAVEFGKCFGKNLDANDS